MHDIQVRELHRSVNLLKSFGCSFKIIAPNGEEFGELEVATAKPKASLKYGKKGLVRAHYKPQIDLNAAVGAVQVIDCGEFEAEDIRSGMCSMLTDAWGKGTYTTCVVDNTVQLMRTEA
jgi:hypothetical protein